MAESIFTVQTPANPDEDDGTELTLGTRFVPTVNGTITAIRWFFPASPTAGTINGRLYTWVSNTVGVLLGNANFVAPTPGTWNTAAVSIPVTAGTPYVAAVYTPLGEYVSTAALFASAITNGNLTATADTPTEENGKFIGGNAYPDDSFNGNGYFVDVLFEAAVTPVVVDPPAGEVDGSFPITVREVASPAVAGEVDSAIAPAVTELVTLTVAGGIDAAFTVAVAEAIPLTVAGEIDGVFSIDVIEIVDPTTAVEVDQALDIGEEATGMPFVDAPCEPWPAMWNDCDLPAGSAAFTGTGLAAASEVLWAMSGRRFSMCPTTLRPCRETCDDGYDTGSWWNWGGGYPRPRFFQGVWTNVTCGQCTDGCSCSFVSKVRLPMPVSRVTNVTIDGVTLASSAYQVYDYRDLVRQDGEQWPECNDLSKPLGQPGTWSITVEVGEPVPVMGRIAVAELATEFVKAFLCDASCQLPAPVQQLSRQGVSMSFLDPNEVFANGRLGLRFADMFLSTFNPDGLRAASRVYSVDNPIGRIPT